ncbi:MAG: GNAT family N-acetyltransferase, partial [Dehalococcoidia bacterium]
MSIGWRVRTAGVEDAQAIIELVNGILGTGDDLDSWRWKFLDNPTKKSYISVAERGGEIIGHLALLGTWMNLLGVKTMGAMSLDLATHPAYRRQGVYTSLTKRIHLRAALDGITIMYGIARPLGLPAALSAGCYDLGPRARLVKICNPGTITKKEIRSPALGAIGGKLVRLLLGLWAKERSPQQTEHIEIKNIDFFDTRFDDLWSKVKNDSPVGVWKDSIYLNWRYCSRPGVMYKIFAAQEKGALTGFVVLRLIDRKYCIGSIVD